MIELGKTDRQTDENAATMFTDLVPIDYRPIRLIYRRRAISQIATAIGTINFSLICALLVD